MKSIRYINTILFFLILGCAERILPPVDHFKNIYGLSTDTLNIKKHEIKDGENLSDILVQNSIDLTTIDKIAQRAINFYDVRKMRSGNTYFILSVKDTLGTPKFMVYERNPVDFVVFELVDSLNIYLNSKPISVDTVSTTGTIDESLCLTMLENSDDPNLVIKLSEIYAWTIDFFGIQKGDRYKIIYESMYADTQYVGVGNIITAEIEHVNSLHYAFQFEQDSTLDYFDETGGSLRRAFLKAPLRYSRISSRFSYNRKHPILKIRRPHLGIDYVAPIGTPVQSIGDGVVVRAGRRSQEGRFVEIKHNSTYSTMYLHLSRYGQGIRSGANVEQGQVIGFVGSSGLSTGAHLYFRFYKNGQPVDPLRIKSPPVNPVYSENITDFNKIKDRWVSALDSINIEN